MDISSVASRSVAAVSGGDTGVHGQAIPATSGSAAPKAAAGVNAAAQTMSPERVAQAVKQLNEDFIQKGQNVYASYEKDKATGISVVKVLDKNTQEVVSQFPPKEIIAIAEAIDRDQEAKGRLIHTSA